MIREARLLAGLSQGELGARVGKDRAQIARWERGAVEPSFETLRQLAAEGRTVLYISHKLDEIRELCSRATVLRGGRVTGRCDPREETAATLARLMIGRELPQTRHGTPQTGPPRLVLDRLSLLPADEFGTALHAVAHALTTPRASPRGSRGQRRVGARMRGEFRVRAFAHRAKHHIPMYPR